MKWIQQLLGVIINSTAPLAPKWNGHLAFRIFCTVPPQKPINPRIEEFYSALKSETISLGKHEVMLHSMGQGPTKLLFLHGWMGNAYHWRKYTDALDPSQYTVYLLEAPGHGQAGGKHLNLELYRLGVEQALARIGPVELLIGHSLGSLTAAYTFLKEPALPVNRFVITGAPEGIGSIIAYFQEQLKLSPLAVNNLKAKIEQLLLVPIDQLNLPHFFAQVDRPTLIVHEETDLVTPIGPIRAGLPDNDYLAVHFTQGDDHRLLAETTVATVLQFINQNTHVYQTF
ncbi:alpha/beta fold hydrolase [Croceiramulus getboli]|nr:alpha/beta fold hydrolase [Flavobacteriaceae bacterium YJPT1-3]